MPKAKVEVNGVDILVLPEFREVLKKYDRMAHGNKRLVGLVSTRWNEEYNLDEVMNCSMYSAVGIQHVREMLFAAIADYDRVAEVKAA